MVRKLVFTARKNCDFVRGGQSLKVDPERAWQTVLKILKEENKAKLRNPFRTMPAEFYVRPARFRVAVSC